MLVGIHHEAYQKSSNCMKVYEKILDFNNIKYIYLDAGQPDFWEKIAKLDLFIYRGRVRDDQKLIFESIIPVIENHYGVKCYPAWNTYSTYDDKIKQYYLLKSHNLPVIKSWIFFNRKEALSWVKTAQFPVVFKLKSGAASSNVILVKSKNKAKRLIKMMFGRGVVPNKMFDLGTVKYLHFNPYKSLYKFGGNMLRRLRKENPYPLWAKNKDYVLFQKFLPGNDYDTRILTIGERAFGLRRYNRKRDFRSSGSGEYAYDRKYFDTAIVRIALDISKEMKFQTMNYDFLYNENGMPEFCEISCATIEETFYKCPGYWDFNLDWHEGNFWPQYFYLMDGLGLKDLKQPKIDL